MLIWTYRVSSPDKLNFLILYHCQGVGGVCIFYDFLQKQERENKEMAHKKSVCAFVRACASAPWEIFYMAESADNADKGWLDVIPKSNINKEVCLCVGKEGKKRNHS